MKEVRYEYRCSYLLDDEAQVNALALDLRGEVFHEGGIEFAAERHELVIHFGGPGGKSRGCNIELRISPVERVVFQAKGGGSRHYSVSDVFLVFGGTALAFETREQKASLKAFLGQAPRAVLTERG